MSFPAKDVVGRVIKKFGVSESEAKAMTVSSLDAIIRKEAEKYLEKAELFDLPFQDILRMRAELLTAPTLLQEVSAPAKVPVAKK